MLPRMMYIEQKTKNGRSLNDQGDTTITTVTFSRTGKTVYVNGLTLNRGNYMYGNYRCEETGDEYWVSGIKKNGLNKRRGDRSKIEKKENRRLENGGR